MPPLLEQGLGPHLRAFSEGEYHRLQEARILLAHEQQVLVNGCVVSADTRRPRLFTANEYHRMAEVGILHPAERVEFINGRIFSMSPKGPVHTEIVNNLESCFQGLFEGRARLRREQPVELGELGQPEPDMAVLRLSPRRYVTNHPKPENIRFVVEVADTTLTYDLTIKNETHSRSGIKEYWVVDINNRRVFVFTRPGPSRYRSERICTEDESVSPAAFADAIVPVRVLLDLTES
ncbi:Uma2 family endonuclease [Gloeobacter violaceus]|uniref:Uma2 family endonuclease n=1 Tax=Gloeobacter violaceus TaxID=33072 RepID=UPI0013E8D5BA|nr:Uma2 family endonuclease [Gloeobacter violaceus]